MGLFDRLVKADYAGEPAAALTYIKPNGEPDGMSNYSKLCDLMANPSNMNPNTEKLRNCLSRIVVIVFCTGIGWIIGYSYGKRNGWAEYSTEVKAGLAQEHCKQFVRCIEMYYQRYGKWPSGRNGKPDFTYGPGTQMEIIDALSEPDEKYEADCMQIDMHAFKDGQIFDPWGVPYFIVFDADGDGVCQTERWGVLKGRGPFVWSEGNGAVRSWDSAK